MNAPRINPRAAARAELARRLVASVDQEMCYLGWFLAISRKYKGPVVGWGAARATILQVRETLSRAEALLRTDITRAA